ncbi:hypothetical protein D3C76_1883570 [compost metagenome]
MGIVNEARRNTDRSDPATALVILFENDDIFPDLGEISGGDQTVAARANDDYIT